MFDDMSLETQQPEDLWLETVAATSAGKPTFDEPNQMDRARIEAVFRNYAKSVRRRRARTRRL
jgi:hypothetical protein